MSIVEDRKIKIESQSSAWTHSNNIAHGSRKRIGLKDPNILQGGGTTGENCKINTKTEYNCKPLNKSASAQVSFRGFNNLWGRSSEFMRKEFSTQYKLEKISEDELLDAVKEVKRVSVTNAKKFLYSIQEMPKLLGDEDFIKYLPLDKDAAEKFKATRSYVEKAMAKQEGGTFYKLPQKTFRKRIFESLSAPAKIVKNIVLHFQQKTVVKRIKTLIGDKKASEASVKDFLGFASKKKDYAVELENLLKNNPNEIEKKLDEEINKYKYANSVYNTFSNLVGTKNSIDAWKRVSKKRYGSSNIPVNVLEDKILRRLPKQVDQNKAKYSTSVLSPLTRILSGVIAGYFLSVDNYNMTRLLNDDPHEAKKEGVARGGQEAARVSIESYLQGFGFGVFKEACDRSIKSALGTNLTITALSNIFSRKLLNRPITPISTKEAQNRVKKQNEKDQSGSGLGAVLGSVLSGKRIEHNKSKNVAASQNKVAFTGLQGSAIHKLFHPQAEFSVGEIKKYLTIIEEAENKINKDINLSKEFEDILKEGKSASIKESLTDTINNYINHSQKDHPTGKTLDDLDDNTQLLLGQKLNSKFLLVFDSVFAPVIAVGKKVRQIPELGDRLRPKAKLNKMMEDINRNPELKEIYKKNLKEVANELKLKDIDKIKFYAAKKTLHDTKPKLDKNIEAVQKILNYVKDYEKKAEANKEPLDLMKKIEGALGFKGTDYDSTTYQVLNINLARVLTGLFIVSDAYNLAMEYSNGNKDVAKQKAKKRAVQEVCRIVLAGYIVNLTTKLTKKWQNRSMAAALLVVAANNIFNETVARKSVGQPITPKSRAEMQEMEKQVAASKNPITKFFARIMGKKSLEAQAGIDEGNKQSSQDDKQTSFTRLNSANTSLFSRFDSSKKFSQTV